MRSLRMRLIALWATLAVSAIVTGFLLLQFYRQSANVQVAQAEDAVVRACRSIGDRYAFYVSGWHETHSQLDDELKDELLNVVRAALLRAAGVEGGIWHANQGSLAYAYPTYEGTGPKTDLPVAEISAIRQVNADALQNDHTETVRQSGQSQVLMLHACLLAGPIPQLTAWTMTRVYTGQGQAYNQLLIGLGVLGLSVFGSAVWLAQILLGWSRKIARLQAALVAREGGHADFPALAHTGERELDRLVDALNTTGARLKDERQRATAAERLAAVGRLASGLAHEIRNPIAAMRLKAENALSCADERRPRAALKAILEQVGRLDALLRDLLTMTQRRQPNSASVDIPKMLVELADAHAELAAARGVELGITETDPLNLVAHFDRDQVTRALDNLILNAIQSTPSGGTIKLSASVSGDRLHLQVHDSGTGVSEDIRQTLFEPFVTTRADGTGLGLAIVGEIARAHGGEGRLLPSTHGALFDIELPWPRS